MERETFKVCGSTGFLMRKTLAAGPARFHDCRIYEAAATRSGTSLMHVAQWLLTWYSGITSERPRMTALLSRLATLERSSDTHRCIEACERVALRKILILS